MDLKDKLNSILQKNQEEDKAAYIKRLVKHLEDRYGFVAFHKMLWKKTRNLTESRKQWAEVAQTITGNEAIYVKAIEQLYDEHLIN